MPPNAIHILSEALGLSASQRGEIAARLLESLETDADPDADAAWDQEIRMRLDDVRSGKLNP
jgi:Putative addiction module component